MPSGAIGRLGSAQTLWSGVKVAAGQDRFNKSQSIGASSTTFKVATPDTAGALFAMEQANTKPGGPPRHLHHDQDEFWYVLVVSP
jgi:mannose-6-phosphate isomerase-like protein (cupin superfamily)